MHSRRHSRRAAAAPPLLQHRLASVRWAGGPAGGCVQAEGKLPPVRLAITAMIAPTASAAATQRCVARAAAGQLAAALKKTAGQPARPQHTLMASPRRTLASSGAVSEVSGNSSGLLRKANSFWHLRGESGDVEFSLVRRWANPLGPPCEQRARTEQSWDRPEGCTSVPGSAPRLQGGEGGGAAGGLSATAGATAAAGRAGSAVRSEQRCKQRAGHWEQSRFGFPQAGFGTHPNQPVGAAARLIERLREPWRRKEEAERESKGGNVRRLTAECAALPCFPPATLRCGRQPAASDKTVSATSVRRAHRQRLLCKRRQWD